MGNPRAEKSAQAAKESAKKDAQLLVKLVKLWAPHTKRSLKVRLDTGRVLNASLGQPIERQRRGRSVLKQAAEKLHTSVSELNRMRWFAYFSENDSSCWGTTDSDNRSWTMFKELLPGLIAALKGNEKRQRSSGDKKNAVIDGVLKGIRSMISRLGAEDVRVDGAQREELIGGLRDLLSAISSTCSIRFHLETEDETGCHGLTEAVAASDSSRLRCFTDTVVAA